MNLPNKNLSASYNAPQATLKVGINRLPHSEGLELPYYATSGSSGADLYAALPKDEKLIILPGERKKIPTGIILVLPEGYEGQIRPRSGLAWKQGVTVINSVGTIDSDYRGEIMVLLVNLGKEDVKIERGDRIAQLVVAPVTRCEFSLVDQFTATDRGTGGFGSTGIK